MLPEPVINTSDEKSSTRLAGLTVSHRNLQAGMAIGLTAIAGIATCLPVFRDRLQGYYALNNTQFGFLLNIGGAIGVAGALAGGPLIARIGPRKTLRICLTGCVIGMILAACPGSWLLLLAALSVIALFVSPLNIALQTYLVELYPERRRQILSLGFVATSIFLMLFPLLAEGLLALSAPGDRTGFGWTLHGLFAVTAVILIVGIIAGKQNGPKEIISRGETETAGRVLSAGAVIFLVALLSLHATVDTVLFIWIPRVLSSTSYTYQPLLPGTVIASYSFAYVVSRFLLSFLPENRWRRRLMVVPGLLGGTLFIAGILSRNQIWTAAGYVAGAFAWSVEFPVFLAALTGSGRQFGSAVGVMTACVGFASFGLGTALGVLGDHLGDDNLWRILLVPACGFPIVGLGGLCWVIKYGHQNREAQTL